MTLEAMNGHGVKLQFLTSVKSCQIMLLDTNNIITDLSSTDFLAEPLLHCYGLGGLHMALFLYLADRFKLHKNKVSYFMLVVTYTSFIVAPTTALPYLIHHGKQHEIGLVRMSSYFGVILSAGFVIGAMKRFRKLSTPRKIIFAVVYTLCFALPTCLGVYYLSLDVILWNTKINVAGSSFVGIFIFYLSAMMRTNEACGITQPTTFHNMDAIYYPALLSTALTAYKSYGCFWNRSSSNSVLHDTPICFMDRCDSDVLFKNVPGIFEKI